MKREDITTGNTRIGWIGTGVMGHWMCGHLLAAGYRCSVFNRTRERAQALLNDGAEWADSPAAVAAVSNIIFTIVGFPPDVRQVYFGEQGILRGAEAGSILVDMTTTEPSLSVEIAEAATGRKAYAVDAPVSGGDVGAREARLAIMVGGDREVVNHIMPLFRIMGSNIVYQGGAGSGQHTKMCNQITIAGTMIGVCEALIYGHKAGLDLEIMLASISGGAAACWTLDNLAPRILKRNFDPGFFVEHFIKDMAIALDEARRMNLSLPGLALVHQLYMATQALGHGKCGTHALMLAIETICNQSMCRSRTED